MTMRTHYCGELRSSDIGSTVTVCGWVDTRRVHSEHLAFIDLRDHTGIIQCVVDEKLDLRSEFVVSITGTVRSRFEGKSNEKLSTGEVELGDCSVELLSSAEPPPFPMHERSEVDENIRLRHRYLDLRKTRMQKNLRIRAQVNSAIRNAMEKQGFVEIETPMLIASTPEGARDFVVPSRLHPSNFYALPQSPQIFKQLCMVGGIDRYYQIARCLRDEDLRADRQFEFMQLDMEASFVTQENILTFVSEAIKDSVENITGERPGEIPTMTWHDAMERFGSDKPDTRFGMELIELSDIFQETEANVFKVDCVKGILYPKGAETLGRNAIDALTEKCQSWGAKGLAWFKVGENSSLEGALTKFMSDREIAQLTSAMGANSGDMIFVIADQRRTVNHILGLLRLELARPPVGEGGLNFLWITEFPLFESVTDSGEPIPAHHPFTMPHTDDLEMLDTASGEEYLSIRSQAYDLVLNGWELGSGSVRIHKKDIQAKIFSMLGIQDEEAEQKFGFLLDAFKYGAPPHAGFAFGIDRLVALLAGEENIREVIAFPKTQSGSDPLTNAPTPLDPTHLEELGLRLAPETT
ncbi:MAG: aspartate--tRNA(Asp/Asn) ligase [Actinomycetota bacterium]|jgi:aspartyl-tRNA synthetase|nr:aspartate--tRNA ligase [Actinomycetota bacterium]MED5445936.1 aspartate--tRNA ligase [Actinomycetota bacterium]GIS55772.1 MAG: aspartate--tRNA(Asp/Asn) ligase [Actinomycetota bacterium]|tara:strand:- start:539 stop:2278 length:1740 start_codon:yes stop_codon:yes gene_type:complete